MTTLGANTTPAASLNLYVESAPARVDGPAALSGRWVAQPLPNAHADGIIGTLKGTTVTLVLLSNQLAADTVDVFDGQLKGDTLTGAFRHAGAAVFVK